MNSFLVFSGTSHPHFSKELASALDTQLGEVRFQPFPDGEIGLEIKGNVRGKEVFVIQSIARKPNTYLMEMLIMIDALKRASSKSIAAVIPYFGYARQDRLDRPHVPITAKLVADLLTAAGASRVLTMDLHAGQIQGFFDIPVDNLFARPILADAIANLQLDDFVVMAPDLGAIKIARSYAGHLKKEFAVIDKRRRGTETVEAASIIGEISGRNVVIVDDMLSTGGTVAAAAAACKKGGAKRIFAACTHALFVGGAMDRILSSAVEKIFISNTVPFPETLKHPKVIVMSVAGLFAEAVRCVMTGEPIPFETGDYTHSNS